MIRKIVLRDAGAAEWLIFDEPLDTLIAGRVDEVAEVLESVERHVRTDGLFAAGFIAYEAAPAFDPAFVTRTPGPLPLVSFGIFRKPVKARTLPDAASGGDSFGDWRMDTQQSAYRRKVAAIKREIANGNTYQVNFTVRQLAADCGDAWRLFLNIAVDAPYAAYVDCGRYAIVSASPELFFELSGDRLTCRPMKGTAPRGMTTHEDSQIREALANSPKDRAENVMIADMVRNDVGRIALPGTVQAQSLFDVEKYRTVWQMTSTVNARTTASVTGILRALFPSASITGAPKVASMRLIAELERHPRQVYTGCIGFLGPGRQARFNVAIRTAVIDRSEGAAVYGVGGGIVWDSDADAEYRECLNKAAILGSGAAPQSFRLLETLRGSGGCSLIDRHLARLAESARYFGFPCDLPRIESELRAFAAGLAPATSRIRLLLDSDGGIALEALATPPPASRPVRLSLAPFPVDRRNPFLYHKTTQRETYERALAAAGRCDDVLLWNDRGEITESSIANVVVRLEGRLYTPPVACGLLAGTLRASLLDEGRFAERVIRLDELPRVEEIYLINALRGWRSAVLDEQAKAVR